MGNWYHIYINIHQYSFRFDDPTESEVSPVIFIPLEESITDRVLAEVNQYCWRDDCGFRGMPEGCMATIKAVCLLTDDGQEVEIEGLGFPATFG